MTFSTPLGAIPGSVSLGTSSAKTGRIINYLTVFAGVLHSAYAGVCGRVFMSVWAMSFASAPCPLMRVVSTGAVRFWSYKFHVAMADARACSTQVVNLQSIWDWTVGLLVSPTVSTNRSPCVICTATNPETSIAIPIGRPSPHPATTQVGALQGNRAIPVDFGPESLKDRSWWLSAFHVEKYNTSPMACLV